MDLFVIRGGTPLAGRVRVGGSKNAALPIMAAALACDGPLTLANVPDLVDVRSLVLLLERLGMAIERLSGGRLRLEVDDDRPCLAEYELVRKMRASVCVLGPLLARRRRARVSLPGGCNIGHRPVDLHLKGLAALGADLRIERGYVVAEARQLRGATVSLAGPFGSTVTGTCNVLCAAALAHGRTVIQSAACEPEIVALAECLQHMGARIAGAGTPTIDVDGVERLQAAEHTIIPDRIEAATLLCAAIITRGRVRIDGVVPSHLTAVCDKLRELGADVSAGQDHVLASAPRPLRPADCIARPYPAIPTDVQAQLTAVLTQAAGTSLVADRVFPDRFMHVSELLRMGADIRREGNGAVIRGPSPLTGAPVMASDLRASAALVLAGLAAQGETVIRRIYHLDRGYERLEDKLTALGASVRRVRDGGAAHSDPFASEGTLPPNSPEVWPPPPHFASVPGAREVPSVAGISRPGGED
jgi:UDP-N-acetylglucosamine 1-carboxyvinyltransferase